MSDIGEGDCAVQCWICPKCFEDHLQNRECKKIDLWEVVATNGILLKEGSDEEQVYAERCEEILALIDLVRKKDEALRAAHETIHYEFCSSDEVGKTVHWDTCLQTQKALALTKELK